MDGTLLIKAGKADAMIAGGSEAVLLPLFHAAFEAMRVLAPPGDPPATTSRPFDLHRAGFVPGEGAAALVLEELEQAQARGASIYAEVAAAAAPMTATTWPRPTRAAAACSTACGRRWTRPACRWRRWATSTRTARRRRSGTGWRWPRSREVFGEHADGILISSIKPATGHMMGASGALEVAVTALALKEGVIPPTLNYETPDPECDLDCVPNQARRVALRAGMSISAGLGGHNAAVLLQRWDGSSS